MTATQTVKVLIVDNNATMREMVRNFIPLPAEQVVECTNGLEALMYYRTFRPQLVLMDLKLDNEDGIGITRSIRREFPDAHIIMVSSYGDRLFRTAAKEAGASGYMLKDDLPELTSLIQNLVTAIN